MINSRVAERTHLKQNMGKMDMPKIKPIIRSVAWGALTLFSSGVIAQTPNHLATDPILPFRAAARSLPSQAQLDAQPQLSLPSDQQIRQAQSRQTEDFKKGMAKAEGGPGAGSGFRPFSGAASDQQRDAYRQSVNAASSQFTERFARSATDEGSRRAGSPGQEDRLQELLRQQQAAQQTRERRNNSGTAAVPEDALLVFVSFSMPDHVLRALSDQARAVGATLILRVWSTVA